MGYVNCKNCNNTFYTLSEDNNLCEFCGGERNDKRKIGYIAYVWNKQLLKKQINEQPYSDNTPEYIKKGIEQHKIAVEQQKAAAEIKVKLGLVDDTSERKTGIPEIVSDFGLVPITDFKKIKRTKGRHIDFYERNLKNSKVGEKGEELVLRAEKEQLLRLNRSDLAQKIKQVSMNNDSAGYDIVSYEEDGKEKLIEVKSTNRPMKNKFSFYISSNEKNIAENSNNYYIYLVFEVFKENPRIIRLKNPFSSNMLYLEPIQYLVRGASSF